MGLFNKILIKTLKNTINELEKDLENQKDMNKVHKHNEVIDILIGNMLDMLKELEKDYKKYIKVEI